MEISEIIKEFKEIGVMDNLNIFLVTSKKSIDKKEIDIIKEFKNNEYQEVFNFRENDKEAIFFNNLRTPEVKTTLEKLKALLKVIQNLEGKKGKKFLNDFVSYWIKKDEPIFIISLNYVGVIAPRIENE